MPNTAAQNEWKRKRRAELAASNICIRCAKRPTAGTSTCLTCQGQVAMLKEQAKRRARDRERKRLARLAKKQSAAPSSPGKRSKKRTT